MSAAEELHRRGVLLEERRQRIATLEAELDETRKALTRIADEQKVYKGNGNYDIIPALDADEAQLVARAALSARPDAGKTEEK